MRTADRLLAKIEQAKTAAYCEVLQGEVLNSEDMLTSSDFIMLLNKINNKLWALIDYQKHLAKQAEEA